MKRTELKTDEWSGKTFIAKKNIKFQEDFYIEEGKKYKITFNNDYNVCVENTIMFSVNLKEFTGLSFYDYFCTEKELRKEKLNKINGR